AAPVTKGGPQWRVSSPTSGRSILITSAPRSASNCPHQGPASTRASSMTRRPSSGRETDWFISGKGADAGDRAAEDQRVDVVRALIGVHRLEIHGVADHMIFGRDAVAAMHVARGPRDIERLAAIVALQEADPIGGKPPLVDQPPHAQRGLGAERDLGEHVCKLELHDLVRRKRPPELLALKCVAASCFIAEFCGTHSAPADAVARTIEAAKWALQP